MHCKLTGYITDQEYIAMAENIKSKKDQLIGKRSAFYKKNLLFLKEMAKMLKRSRFASKKGSSNYGNKQVSGFIQHKPHYTYDNKRDSFKISAKVSLDDIFTKQEDPIRNKLAIDKKTVLSGSRITNKAHSSLAKIFSASSIALLISVLVVSPGLLGSNMAVYAMGSPPGTCGNEYNYTLNSMTVNNGVHTFNLLANQGKGFIFNANNGRGYDVTVTVHTADQSRSNNTQSGSIWYRTTSLGYGNGVCITGIGPHQNKTVIVKDIIPGQKINNTGLGNGNPNDLQMVEWDFDYFAQKITYWTNWYTSTNFPTNTGITKVKIEALDYNNTDFSNNKITGMYVNLKYNGKIVDHGFSPVTFTLKNGKEYEIGVANYGKYHFQHWGDNYANGAIRQVKVAETGKVILLAYYIEKEPNSRLTIRTEDSNGHSISGYWTVLSQNGITKATEFSPKSFVLNNRQGYSISVLDYGKYVFDHWKDTGSTTRDRNISISADTQITAVYRHINNSP